MGGETAPWPLCALALDLPQQRKGLDQVNAKETRGRAHCPANLVTQLKERHGTRFRC